MNLIPLRFNVSVQLATLCAPALPIKALLDIGCFSLAPFNEDKFGSLSSNLRHLFRQ